MATYQFSNLLGCNTLLDWTIARKECPQMFVHGVAIAPQYRDIILYFALQNVSPFQVCVVKHEKEYMLLHGQTELQILFDFVFGRTVLQKDQWTLSVPFPSPKEVLSYADGLRLHEKEHFLGLRIPSCDFSVKNKDDLELLHRLYAK